jgi:hypothetical protein
MSMDKLIALAAFILATADMAYSADRPVRGLDYDVEESKGGESEPRLPRSSSQTGSAAADDTAFDLDETPEQRATRIAHAEEFRAILARRTAIDPADKIEEHLSTSRILMFAPEAKAAIEAGMNACIVRLGGKWPGAEHFKVAEQFYLNLPGLSTDLIGWLFAFANRLNWEEFVAFCDPFLVRVNEYNKICCMVKLLPTFKARKTPEDRAFFMAFCEPLLVGVSKHDKIYCTARVLPIFQAWPSPEARAPFMGFCAPYLALLVPGDKAECMAKLFPIFQAWPSAEARAAFMDFCDPFLVETHANQKAEFMNNLLPIFQAWPSAEARTAFMDFCDPFLVELNANQKPDYMAKILPIFQALPTPETRTAFMGFCEPLLIGMNATYKATSMAKLLPLFQAISKNEEVAKNLTAFMGLHNSDRHKYSIISSFLPRTYLRYMRSGAALQAELQPGVVARIQALYETNQFNQLPVLWWADLFLAQARGAAGVAGAHDFETVYKQDYEALVGWCAGAGYPETLSETPHLIHNNTASIPAHHTNVEVEDFITYLDTIASTHNISLVKQMLGLEPKTGTTTGGFAPYLGHSMFYAKPESPKGDEVLGRVWHMMKKRGEGKPDADDYKKSVVLAILDAAEISGSRADTYCQTRITGELMKLLAWHLPDSKLRSLIAANDVPPAITDADISTRITFAPTRAEQIFKVIHREDTGEVYKLRYHHTVEGTDPELWELYQAYYDDLYRRNKVGGVYVFDANTLTRNAYGNLVKAHQADGTLRPADAVEIVYHQAEFQVLEMTFTELMRKEFEEQRGLKY